MTEKNQTGMDDKNKDILSEFVSKPYPPLGKKADNSTPQLITKESEYKAFEEFKGRRSARFRIVNKDGKSYGCSYAHLIDWVYTAPTLLTLTTATRIFTFQGKNLGRIEQLLLEDKIKELHVFNDATHKVPASNKPIIENLDIEEG